MISSTHNPKIQFIRALQSQVKARRERRAFVVEGVRLAEEALASGWPAELVLFTGDLEPRGQAVVAGFAARGTPVEEVTPSVLRAASDTQTPQGILAVLGQRSLPLPEPLDFAFIPDGVRDPGNLGSMLRTAAAAGAEVVLLPPGAADAFAPKVVRSGMGAHFRLPLRACTWEEIGGLVQTADLRVYLAAAGDGLSYTQADFRQPLALVVGSEAQGAGRESLAMAHQQVTIPMPGETESLNAAAAAAILLFEVVRQRKEKL